MRCTNKKRISVMQRFALQRFALLRFSMQRFALFCSTIICIMSLAGCSSANYEMGYNPDSDISSFNIISRQKGGLADPFAADLCIVTNDIIPYAGGESDNLSRATASVLFCVDNSTVLYAKNAHETLYPASLTKVLTALVALKYGSPDQVLKATDSVNITESGAQLCGLKSGDTMTLDQALHILLMYSANDTAMMIAENVGGTLERFMEMMNEEARALGATNSNFVNPHGLSDDKHYSTAYDQYLIFNEAIKYDKFKEIIRMTSYQTTYYDKDGNAKELSVDNTNQYFRGNYDSPENVTIMGGKTGTTNAAGHCLILLSRDTNSVSYISVILRSDEKDFLYYGMSDLLEEILK